MKKTYSDKLKDPRWQKKRLEILSRDNFTCSMCNDTEETLHVHHIFYEKGLEPWEYTDCMYQTLCASCHQSLENLKKMDKEQLSLTSMKLKTNTGQRVYLQCLNNAEEMSLYVFHVADGNCEFLFSMGKDELFKVYRLMTF